jgi:hypothetical protein
MDQLKTRFNEAPRKKRLLEEEINGLHRHLLYLKDQILLHPRCDDKVIRIYLARMVKQATKHGLISAVSTEEEVARSGSPPETRAPTCLDVKQERLDLFNPRPCGMCGVDKPIIDPTIFQPAGIICANEISIS